MPIAVTLLLLSLIATVSAGAQTIARTPWTTSRVEGSPEPPKPFTTVPVFTGLELREALEMIAVPGQNRMLVIEKGDEFSPFPISRARRSAWPRSSTSKRSTRSSVTPMGWPFTRGTARAREIFLTYVYGPNLDDGSKLSRFRLRSLDPPVADPASEEVILTWRSGGHNGANVRFGPDGFLYLSTGDSEVPAPPDPLNTGQDLTDLLSSILRIDVDHRDPGRNYQIPSDNPFLGVPGARPENWAYGLRNPWKMSFDPATGNLWCGDVGWEIWEMIHLIRKGGNYGWSARESSQLVRSDTPPNPSPITPPVVSHAHTEAASITGGFVYHGKRFPELEGSYVYGDYETGKIWALWHDEQNVTRHEEIADTPHKIVTFGQDESGELYLIHWGTPATIHALSRHASASQVTAFPRRLSETGLFRDVALQAPAPGVYPYEVAEGMWQDGATAKRFIALPGPSSIQTSIRRRPDGTIANLTVTWPKNTVLTRTLELAGKKVESQLLHYDGEAWNGYTYRWNGQGNDAELVEANGISTPDWQFHGRGECARCHNNWSGFALGFQPQQLTTISGQSASASAVSLGLTDPAFFEQTTARLTPPGPAATVDTRARAWLHANCAHCHRRNGGGSVPIMVNVELSLTETKLLDESPLRGEFGLPNAKVITPGAPERSVLLNRVMRLGSGHMPAIGAREPDPDGIRILRDWIAAMPAASPDAATNEISQAMEGALEEDPKAIAAGLASPIRTCGNSSNDSARPQNVPV